MLRKKVIIVVVFIGLLSPAAYSQIGIRAGVNISHQKFQGISDNVDISELTAFHVGLVYQWMPDLLLFNWFGLGLETGAMFSQKGSMFNILEQNQSGYNELNYIEVPVNLHLRVKFGKFGIYAYGGMFGSCLVNAKTVLDEANGTIEKWNLSNFDSRFDYGYSMGGGVDILRKLQIGFNYSHSLENLLRVQYVSSGIQNVTSIFNRMYSVNVTFLF